MIKFYLSKHALYLNDAHVKIYTYEVLNSTCQDGLAQTVEQANVEQEVRGSNPALSVFFNLRLDVFTIPPLNTVQYNTKFQKITRNLRKITRKVLTPWRENVI